MCSPKMGEVVQNGLARNGSGACYLLKLLKGESSHCRFWMLDCDPRCSDFGTGPIVHMCHLIGVTSLTDQQRVQVPHRHGGMGLRHVCEDVATAARLSSAALAHAALVGDLTRLCLSEAQRGSKHSRLWRGFRRHGLA